MNRTWSTGRSTLEQATLAAVGTLALAGLLILQVGPILASGALCCGCDEHTGTVHASRPKQNHVALRL